MKALVWHGQRDIRLEDVPEPSPDPGWVKIKVKWCGICASDIHEYTAGPVIIPTKRPHPMTGKTAPVILGHEFAGEVVEVGSDVTGINVGDRVTVRPTMPCYECYWCRKGRHILCVRLATLGFAADGAYAEYVVTRADTIYQLPEGVTYEMGAFCEPLAVALHGVAQAKMAVGDTVAVVGTGPIGLLVITGAKAAGASNVFALGTRVNRNQVAKQVGAVEALNPREVDAGKEISNRTNRRRADVVFDCVGTQESMQQALATSGRGGKIVVVGQPTESFAFPFGTLQGLEKEIIGSSGYEDELPIGISYLVDGRINVEPLITTKIKLNDIIEQGFGALTSERKSEHIKILVSPE